MDVRFGKFILVEKLAEGGMGEIFLARQRGIGQFERLVVLKRLRRDLTADERFETLFLEEARISARLSHPNVVQVYEFGHIEDSYFLTLEYVRGTNLNVLKRRLARAREFCPLDVLIEIMVQACAGLTYVHRLEDFDGQPLNVIHRDISPSNIMISREGQVKLLDFGVAHARGAIDPDRRIRGKHSYLSPEQYRREVLDERSDLFSLGVVFWEMLTGSRLFRRPTPEETIAAMLHDPVPPASTLRPEIPPELDAVCLRLLERPREARYRTAEELANALEAIAAAHGLQTGPRVLARFLARMGATDEVDQRSSGGFAIPEPRPPEVAPPTEATIDVNASLGDVDNDDNPAAETLLPAGPMPAASGPVHSLLLVDDEVDNLEAMVRALRSRRFYLFSTSDPAEALRLLEEHPIDLIITDQRMPGMTGLELIQQANRLRPHVLKIIASAYVDTQLLLEAINTGSIHRYVLKPWQPDQLVATVEGLIASQPASVDMVERQVRKEAAHLGMADDRSSSLESRDPTRTSRYRRRRLLTETVRSLTYTGRLALIMVGLQPSELADQVAVWIASRIGPSDTAFPVASGKIAVILLDMTAEDAHALAVRLQREAVQPGAPLEGGTFHFGVSGSPEDTEDADELIMMADMALFHARAERAEG